MKRIFAILLMLLLPSSPSGIAAAPNSQLASQVNSKDRFALLIGVDKYQDPRWDTLRGPGNDVALIQGLLAQFYGFADASGTATPNSHILSLVGIQATHQAIKDAFRHQLIDNARSHSGATVVFYFSGHGSKIPDSDGTNGGNYRSAIVPSDRDINGVSDISQLEIQSWLSELQKYTKKITFILDSCYSGTPTRGIDLSLFSKEIPPDPNVSKGPIKKVITAQPSSNIAPVIDGNLIAAGDGIASIYSSLRYEKSAETDLPNDKGALQRDGVLTYYLVRTLRSEPTLSYREAVDRVSSVLHRSYGQDPEAEGNQGGPIFNGPGISEDPFIKIISGSVLKKQFTIAAGSILGLQKDGFVAIYGGSSKKLLGEDNKIANGRIVTVRNFEADVQLASIPSQPIPADSKVVVISPNMGDLRLRVLLGANLKDQPVATGGAEFLTRLGVRLAKSPLVALTNTDSGATSGGPAKWDLGVQLGCADLARKPASFSGTLASTSHPIKCASPMVTLAYLVTPNNNAPLFDYWLPAESSSVGDLATAIEQKAKQDNLRALSNSVSPLNGLVKLSFIKVSTEVDATGNESIVSEEEVSNDTLVHFEARSKPPLVHIRIRIENDSKVDLDVAILSLGTGDSVTLLTPRGTGTEVKAGTSYVTTNVFDIKPPQGLETYKVIAYTHANDALESPSFGTLEQPGVAALDPKGFSDPLSWLVQQAGTGVSRDTTFSSLNLSSWTVAQADAIFESQ